MEIALAHLKWSGHVLVLMKGSLNLPFGFRTYSPGSMGCGPEALLRLVWACSGWGWGWQGSLTVSVGGWLDAAAQLSPVLQLTGSVGTVCPHTGIFNHSC